MAWIEVHDTLREHHKTYALANGLNIPLYAAVGLVVSLWTWALNNSENGDLSKYPPNAITKACAWDKKPEKLIEVLKSSGFLDENMCLHDWQDYAGKLLDKREANARRNREARERASASRDAVTLDKSKENKVFKAPDKRITSVQRDDKEDRQEHTPSVSRAYHERVTMCVPSASRDGATVPNLTVPNRTKVVVVANSLDIGAEKTATAATEDPFELTEDEIKHHRELVDRLEAKATSYGLPFTVGDIERCLRWAGEYTEPWLLEAIERCSLREKRSWGMVHGILKSWKSKGGIDYTGQKALSQNNKKPVTWD